MAKHIVPDDAPYYRIADRPHYLNGVMYYPGDVVQWGEKPTHLMILVEKDAAPPEPAPVRQTSASPKAAKK
jgi:hypothetical protein